jgi:hypothetical protein
MNEHKVSGKHTTHRLNIFSNLFWSKIHDTGMKYGRGSRVITADFMMLHAGYIFQWSIPTAGVQQRT